MDDAWKKAISEGLKRARRGAGKGIENSGKVIGSRASQKAASIATGTARGFIAGSAIVRGVGSSMQRAGKRLQK
jgi:tryptophan synthase alpha subunit